VINSARRPRVSASDGPRQSHPHYRKDDLMGTLSKPRGCASDLKAARGFLAHLQAGPAPAALRRSAVDREAAELRKLLGQVLDCADARSGVLNDGQREVLGQALADAITYRDPAGFCPGCEAHPAGLCDDHAADLDLTDAYMALPRELGIEVDR
jgi:hypothetical protein